ncbi:MAG: sigma-70 family RNA polymerase sigma factor [Isosphaeraceae bacterium]
MPSIGHEILGSLFDTHARALLLYARQWSRGSEAEDVVQEAFASLARQEDLPEQVVPWLFRTVRNAAISAARSRQRRWRREERASSPEAWFSAADDRIDGREATRLLAELEPDLREVVVARIWGGLTFEQIAALQGCSLTTAHRRYQSGLAGLQERLDRPCATASIPLRTT